MSNLIDMMIDDNPSSHKEAGNAPSVQKVEEPQGPKYPYGLELSLDQDVLEKLGLEGCDVGDVYEITAKAKVKSVNENEYEDDNYNKTVSLQITSMAVTATESDDGMSIGQAEKESNIMNAIENRMSGSIAYINKKK